MAGLIPAALSVPAMHVCLSQGVHPACTCTDVQQTLLRTPLAAHRLTQSSTVCQHLARPAGKDVLLRCVQEGHGLDFKRPEGGPLAGHGRFEWRVCCLLMMADGCRLCVRWMVNCVQLLPTWVWFTPLGLAAHDRSLETCMLASRAQVGASWRCRGSQAQPHHVKCPHLRSRLPSPKHHPAAPGCNGGTYLYRSV